MFVMTVNLIYNEDEIIILEIVSSCKLENDGTMFSSVDSLGRSIYE